MDNVIKCANGACGHPEHAVNALVWLIPAIAVAYLASRVYKKYFK
tara:strand:- start:1307 stop:1441 length:135 start_codon:yes stop_codon:yes gene_type:complete